MVKKMNIECPTCSQTFRLFLSIDTSMVILDCPMCCTPIMYYKSRTFPLSKTQIDRIKSCKQESNVLKILHRISAQESKVHCAQPVSGASHYHARSASFPRQTMLKSYGDRITRDDVINLRIELETCKDAGCFIERM